jgi:hypothetical protein
MANFEFVLAAPGLPPGKRPDVTQWITFFARTSLIEQSSQPALPIFALTRPELFKVVEEPTAISITILAFIRYHFGVIEKALYQFLPGTVRSDLVKSVLEQLTESGEVVLHKGRYYFRYNGVSVENLKRCLVAHDLGALSPSLEALGGLLHPMSPVASTLVDTDGRLLNPAKRPWEVRVKTEDLSRWVTEADARLREEGCVTVSGRGPRRREWALKVVQQVCGKFDAGLVYVRRRDSMFRDSEEREHPQSNFLLLYPMRMLQRRYETNQT